MHCWWEYKFIQSLWRKLWRLLKTLGIKSPDDSAIPLLGRNPEETKSEKYTRNPKFTAALFTIARTWKKPRYPSTDEWIKNLCSRRTHMRALYLSIYIKIYNGILLSHKKEHS